MSTALPDRMERLFPGAIFLPLAFRFAAAFGLMALHLALPNELTHPPIRENYYLLGLLAFFLESVWESVRSIRATGRPFSTPSMGWIRWNLLLDVLLLCLLIAFQGVDQERFATLYIFPVLASAFYLRIPEIVGVGVISSVFHIASVLLFTSGLLPPFGHSGATLDPETSQQTYILGFASIQIFAATLVVVLIRKHLETLRTTLRRSEAAVDDLSALHRHVVDSMFSGLITTDPEGRITSANPAAEGILQCSLDAGTPVDTLGLVDLTQHGSMPREHRFERSFTTPGGAHRIIGGNVAPLRDGEGVQRGHLLLFQDLTEIKALEERTRLSERLASAGELSSELAHELRNPLASILGCVQILKQSERPQAMMDRVLTILRRESERVSDIVSDFLDFTRPRPVRIQALFLPPLLDEVRESWDTDSRNHGLPLHIDSPPQVWTQGDPLIFHQVFTNLLSNARKALKDTPSPQVEILFHLQGDSLRAEVRDNGCGMDAERMNALFLPFSSGFEQGTGLGMSLVFQFVQQMGWDIQVTSAPGLGTTIHLALPLWSSSRPQASDVRQKDPAPGTQESRP